MAVIERSDGYHCGACGGARERHANTECLTDAELLQALEPRLPRSPYLLAFTCALPCSLAGVLARDLSLALRWALALGGVITFGWLLVRDQSQQRRTSRRRTFEIEQRIIGLAYQNDGVLRESEVSERLRISLAEARSVLHELSLQDRAVACGQGHQATEFRFGEARRTRAIRARRSMASERVEAGGSARERNPVQAGGSAREQNPTDRTEAGAGDREPENRPNQSS
jgi:hypothetical protein